MAEFIVSGSYDGHIRTMRAEYRRRREQLVEAIAQSSPETTVWRDACGFARDARARQRRRERVLSPTRVAPARRQGLDFIAIPKGRRARRIRGRVRGDCAERMVGRAGRVDIASALTHPV